MYIVHCVTLVGECSRTRFWIILHIALKDSYGVCTRRVVVFLKDFFSPICWRHSVDRRRIAELSFGRLAVLNFGTRAICLWVFANFYVLSCCILLFYLFPDCIFNYIFDFYELSMKFSEYLVVIWLSRFKISCLFFICYLSIFFCEFCIDDEKQYRYG